jgi:hypothetical protein
MTFLFAPMIAGLVLRSLWVPTQEMYGNVTMACVVTMMMVITQNALNNCL